MGVQVPCGVDSQVSEEDALRTTLKGSGPSVQRIGQAEGKRGCGSHLMADHVHMLISIPPKYGVAQVIGYIKGKSAIHIARPFLGRKKNFTGQSFWARGYFVSTVGRDEETIRQYIKKQEVEDRRLDQLNMFE